MTALRSIPPQQAIEIAERAGIPDARRVIIDFAAAGLVKGYALVIETVLATSETKTVRGVAIPSGLWKRLQRGGHSDWIWRGGTLSVEADPADGLPEVNITGVSFSEKSLHRLVEHHGGDETTIRRTPAQAPQPEESADVKAAPDRRRADSSAIPAGALLATVKQAMAALGLGRTKINALMNDNRLVRKKVDGRTMITVESIRRLAISS